MTRWPTVVEISVCRTPKTLFITAVRIMPRASSDSSPVRPWGMAVSRISRSRNGEATETSDEAPTSSPTSVSRPRYGWKRRKIRRSSAGGCVPSLGGGVHVGSSGFMGSFDRRDRGRRPQAAVKLLRA